jgi:hypothetical protein
METMITPIVTTKEITEIGITAIKRRFKSEGLF